MRAKPRTSRVAWGLAIVLAAVLLGGIGLLFGRLRPYWVAKYRGEEAYLRGEMLAGAPLRGSDLAGADLARANLRGADLRKVEFVNADLSGADLCGADLRGANLVDVDLAGARFDAATQWPAGTDPQFWGAVKVGSATPNVIRDR